MSLWSLTPHLGSVGPCRSSGSIRLLSESESEHTHYTDFVNRAPTPIAAISIHTYMHARMHTYMNIYVRTYALTYIGLHFVLGTIVVAHVFWRMFFPCLFISIFNDEYTDLHNICLQMFVLPGFPLAPNSKMAVFTSERMYETSKCFDVMAVELYIQNFRSDVSIQYRPTPSIWTLMETLGIHVYTLVIFALTWSKIRTDIIDFR